MSEAMPPSGRTRPHDTPPSNAATTGLVRVIGHRWIKELLTLQLAQGQLAHAYLFTGPPGVGKGTLARWFAQALLCTAESTPPPRSSDRASNEAGDTPCGACEACQRVIAENHPDLRLLSLDNQLQEGRRTLGIEAIRELRKGMAERPFLGRRKVYLIEDAETMTVEAANALLKTLEEPPPSVVLLLVALSDHLLLPTIVSRCQTLPLRTPGRQEVQQALQEYWGVDEGRAHLLAALSLGRLGWAVQALQDARLLQQREKDLAALIELIEAGLLERFAFAAQQEKRWKRQEHMSVFGLLEHWQRWWRDLLLIQNGCADLIINVDYREVLEATARQIPSEVARHVLRVLRSSQQRLQQQVNTRLVFEDLFLQLPTVIISAQQVPAAGTRT